MSITRLTPDDFEFTTLETHPKRTYASSSTGGITGSVHLYARRSLIEKEIFPLSMFSASFYKDENIDLVRNLAVQNTSSNIRGDVAAYMDAVSEQGASARLQHKLDIVRFVPPFRFNSNFLRKSLVRTHLMPYYRTADSPRAHYNIGNYHCMNFFTASNVPTDSVLLYPNPATTDGTGSIYQISGAFAFDFYIKPKYTTLEEGNEYQAGVIMHLSNSYCLSVHSGSSTDINGITDRFRLALQLSSSVGDGPGAATTSGSPLTFLSSDNALSRDQWSHVTITWGGENYNDGSGSFTVNQRKNSTFTITESLYVGRYDSSPDPSVLCVGNYYEGGNTGTDALDRFFGNDTTLREGLYELNSGGGFFAPDTFAFTHPLNSEILDLKLYDKYLTTSQSLALSASGPTTTDNLKFYLPPFFTEESPFRTLVGGQGGEIVTPFFTRDATTDTPFAGRLAFGAGGHYINLENYTRDFATSNFPRLWNLTSSIISPPSTTILSANDFLYATGSNIKRLYSVLPCDNGAFTPNFNLLSGLSGSRFVNDLGNADLGVVSLNNIVSDEFDARTFLVTGSMLDQQLGARDDEITALPGNSLAVLHRTRDSSSNQVVEFDISNLYYGLNIRPGSLTLKSSNMKYADFGFTIRDDGFGNLYRSEATFDADANSPNALGSSWNSLGNVFYNEGIILLKSPQLYFFGEQGFEIEFEGEQNIHVLTINAFARPLTQTSSSNPSFRSFDADDLANNDDQKFVYITAVNIHDENLNVITRAKLAQPIVKRSGDKMLFKVKLDF